MCSGPHFLFPVLVLCLMGVPGGPALGYGEVSEGQPSMEERAVHFFTDRLRVEPSAADPEFDTYEAVRPLIANGDLLDAARFYAEDMAENGCFPADHSSCDGTAFGVRLASFYEGNLYGENIAYGSPDPEAVVISAWLYSDGHRENMLNGAWQELGTGHATASGGTPYWVQDFGSRSGVLEPITTSGTHWPLRPGEGTDVVFFLAAYDPDGDPDSAEVVVDGVCLAIGDDRGSGQMRTWVSQPMDELSGCTPYYFVLGRSGGETVTYPETGSLLVGVGDSTCSPWTSERAEADCASGPQSGTFSGTGGGCFPDIESSGPDSNLEDRAEYGSCGLVDPTGGRAPGLVAALLVLGARRRRSQGSGR